MSDKPSKIDITDEMIAERRGGTGKMPADIPGWMARLAPRHSALSGHAGGLLQYWPWPWPDQ